jgi:serine protease AprX
VCLAASVLASRPAAGADRLGWLDGPDAHPTGAFVTFRGGDRSAHQRLLARHGLRVVADFESSLGAVFAAGTAGGLRTLSRDPGVERLDPNQRLEPANDTGPWAIRSRIAQEHVSGGPYRDRSGRVLDGRGIGVAVVDTGIDATHPDLRDRVARNFAVLCPEYAVQPFSSPCTVSVAADLGRGTNSERTSGHGTHVAGIIAGDGRASVGRYDVDARPAVPGTFAGVAPGATLYGFSNEQGFLDAIAAMVSFQYIYDHGADFDPPIRIINNSWGSFFGQPNDPGLPIARLIRRLVEDRGITLVFAAGNTGGDGTADQTSSIGKDPTPGVIMAAAYDDNNTGDRDFEVASFSSKGAKGHPETYPDVSAPGAGIVSTCPTQRAIFGPIYYWAPWYCTASGTSMATPATSGAAALLYQARPELTPAEFEDVLKDTAHRYADGGPYEPDPRNPDGVTSFDKGAGLVDVNAALDALGVSHADEPEPDERVLAIDEATPGPGGPDIERLAVGARRDGFAYDIVVRDAAAILPGNAVRFTLRQSVDGKPFVTNVILTAAGLAPDPGPDPLPVFLPATTTAPATETHRDADTLSFFVPFANLGSPASGAPVHNVLLQARIPDRVWDWAPGTGPGEPTPLVSYAVPYAVP